VIWLSDPVPIREAARETGTDEFEGTVQAAEEPVLEPFSGAEAVLSTYEVKRRESDPDNEGSEYRTVAQGQIYRPLLVEDETGCVRLDPTDAEIAPGNRTRRASAATMLPEGIRLRLSVLTDEIDLEPVLAQTNSRNRRYYSGYIAPGDRIHVYGTSVTEHSPDDPSVDAIVASSPESDLFKITAGGEWAAVKQDLLHAATLAAIGLAFAGFGLIALLI
jgi:hypothetical protein